MLPPPASFLEHPSNVLKKDAALLNELKPHKTFYNWWSRSRIELTFSYLRNMHITNYTTTPYLIIAPQYGLEP